MRPLVIDLGTYTTKIGLAPQDFGVHNETFPQIMVPTMLGQTKLLPGRLSDTKAAEGQTYVGFEALRRSSLLSLKYPMEHGIVMDWDEITQLLEHTVREGMKLEFDSLTSGLMMTESPLNPKAHRERLTQLAFEQFEVPRFQVSMNAMNALYSEALTSGLVLECGEGLSTCVPIFEGYVIHNAIQRLDVGGRDVNEYLMELLKPKVVFSTTFEREFARDIKEQCCFVTMQNSSEKHKKLDKKRYQLPDGKIVDLTFEQSQAPEVLFDTSLIGRDDGQNVQNLVSDALEKCEIDCRKTLSQNFVLSGGSTMFKGFS